MELISYQCFVLEGNLINIIKKHRNIKFGIYTIFLLLVTTLFSILGVGTIVFDTRIGLYDDPPNKDEMEMIHATMETFGSWGKPLVGWESLLFRFAMTPSYRKFCKPEDTMLAIGQKFVDKKVTELKKQAEQGMSFVENQGQSLKFRTRRLPLPLSPRLNRHPLI